MPIRKSNVMRLLEQAGVEYTAYEYDGEGGRITGVQIAERIGQPVGQVYKTLVTTTDKREYFVFVVPVAGELDLKAAARAAGVKALEMLPLKKLFPLTGYMHGGCSPIGIRTQMRVFFDSSAEVLDKMYVSGGRIGLNLSASPADLARVAGATFAPFAK